MDQEPTVATTNLMTAEDLWLMEEDECRYELVEGELIRRAPAGWEHGEIGVEITRRVGNYLAENRLGKASGADTGFILARNPDVVRAPDLAYVRADRLPPKEQRRAFLELAPDLVVEIVSPSDSSSDVNDKVMQYLDLGVKLVWLVHPSTRSVNVYTHDRTARILSEDDELNGGEVLPGFRLRIADIFV
jgi:Uma2 family endonuclease